MSELVQVVVQQVAATEIGKSMREGVTHAMYSPREFLKMFLARSMILKDPFLKTALNERERKR